MSKKTKDQEMCEGEKCFDCGEKIEEGQPAKLVRGQLMGCSNARLCYHSKCLEEH